MTSLPGHPTCQELIREAAADQRPRRDYVELARRLNADVIDRHWMQGRGFAASRALAARAGLPAGQVLEGFLRRGQYRHMLAWADRIGLPLALLFKLARSRRDLALVSIWISRGRKAVFVKRLHVQSHLSAVITRTAQAEIAEDLGVPREKLHVWPQPVDDLFWRPLAREPRRMVCAVGWEARDYPTLLAAVSGLDVDVELAVGSIALPEMARGGHVDRAV